MKERTKGTILKLSPKGWGYISSKEIKFTRIFFHWTSLKQTTLSFPDLKVGMDVDFEALHIPGRGWRALHIQVIEKKEKTNGESSVSPLSE